VLVTHDGGSRTPRTHCRRAPQHVRLFEADDACKHLCILTNATKPSPFSALCSQIHRRLAVLVPSSHLWVHCPRASNGLLPRRSYLVGYVRWDARSDLSSLPDNLSNRFPGRSLLCLMSRLALFSRVKHLREVCPLSRPVMLSMWLTQPISAPLQSSIRFLPHLLSAPPSVRLAMYFPLAGSDVDLPCSVGMTR
jgi:hypothetical protein